MKPFIAPATGPRAPKERASTIPRPLLPPSPSPSALPPLPRFRWGLRTGGWWWGLRIFEDDAPRCLLAAGPTSRTQAAASEREAEALSARGGGPIPRPPLVGARPRACRRAEGACLCAPEGRGPRGTRRAPPIPQAPTRERKYVSEGRGRQREMQRARAREIGNKEERDAGMQGVRDGGTVDGARGEGRRGADED